MVLHSDTTYDGINITVVRAASLRASGITRYYTFCVKSFMSVISK